MILDDIAVHNCITIQCHDNPDADALASGYGLYLYFSSLPNKRVKLIYSGKEHIRKRNFLMMIEKLDIPIVYVNDLYRPEGILVTVDCQYGSGNVTKLLYNELAIIDHHQPGNIEENAIADIRPEFGSCSTIIWTLLLQKHFPVELYKNLQTALYYGLYTDTTSFYEMYNPLDRDMQDSLHPDFDLIKHMNNSTLSSKELGIAGLALIRAIINEKQHFAILNAEDCEPNLLGMISDFALQVDSISTCIVYTEHMDEIKFSVRSCDREIHANELAVFVADGMGNGGGHFDKAGGTISKEAFENKYPELHLQAFFSECYQKYLKAFDVIYADTYKADISKMQKYHLRRVPQGYVLLNALYPEGTVINIRTEAGDTKTTVDSDSCLILDAKGGVVISDTETLSSRYEQIDAPFIPNAPYSPTVRDETGSPKILEHFAKTCLCNSVITVYAIQLEKNLKLFPTSDSNYTIGLIGDYLVAGSDNLEDISIVDSDSFATFYKPLA